MAAMSRTTQLLQQVHFPLLHSLFIPDTGKLQTRTENLILKFVYQKNIPLSLTSLGHFIVLVSKESSLPARSSVALLVPLLSRCFVIRILALGFRLPKSGR